MHNKDGYYGGPSAAGVAGKGETGAGGTGGSGEYVTGLSKSGSGHTSGGEYRADSNAGQAPSYVGNVTGSFRNEGDLKPKGRNIREGGFDNGDDAQNASFSGEIGTENDPGRNAEQKFQRMNAEAAADAGSGPRQKGIESRGVGYGNLDLDEQA